MRNTLALMIALHMLADYPLQGDFLSKAKNRRAPIPGVPWWQALGAHSIIHGLFVGLVTRRLSLGVAEALIHAWADDAKCRGRLTYNQDQTIHLACKVLWAVLARRTGDPA